MRALAPSLLLASLLALHPSCWAETPAPAPAAPSKQVISTDLGPVAVQATASTLPADWWRHAVFMEIMVRAYQDSNGDGVGDLKGIIQRLPYLKMLGIRGLWLTPIFSSADHDHGYAVKNYRQIDNDLGSMDDFDALLREAHALGMGVILDYVANHSSGAHPLFKASTQADSPYRRWYSWLDKDPGNYQTWNGDPWRQHKSGVFYATFWTGMPDFNFDEPAVLDFHRQNLRFWLNRGVDGFRFDAVSEIYHTEEGLQDGDRSAAVMQQLVKTVREYPNKYVICEASSGKDDQNRWAAAVFASDQACGSAFGFYAKNLAIEQITQKNGGRNYQSYWQQFPSQNMGTALNNHDGFLGKVGNTFKGRLWEQVEGDWASYRLAASLNLLLPGIPFVYYGEEIGMGVQTKIPSEDVKLRAPMSWDSGSGFSSAEPYHPYADNRATHNLAQALTQPDSIWATYRDLIALRNAHPALQTGSVRNMEGGQRPGTAWVVQRESPEEIAWIAFNPAPEAHTLSFDLPEPAQQVWPATAISREKNNFTLPARASVVWIQSKSKP